jgi:type I restriction enzyme S subunit
MASKESAEQLPMATPQLRFAEFKSHKWDRIHGDELFDLVNNRDAEPGLPVLAITQEHGPIPRDQIDYHVSVTEKSVESYKVVEPGDFIISLRSFQGGIEYSKVKGICSPAYVILRRKGEGSDEFFKHLFKSERFIQHITRNIEGLRDGKMISFKQFSEQLISTPSPIEQQKIADCLTSLDDVIAAQARKVAVLADNKRGLMQQLFPAEGENIPRLRFPQFRGSPRWEEATLGEIADISSGTTPLRANRAFYEGGTIPWVKTTDLNNSFVTTTEERITAAAKAAVNPAGSIVVAMYGGFKQIGRTGYLTMPAATNQALSVLQVSSVDVLPLYLLVWLNAKVDNWKRLASSSRKDPNITGSDVARFPILYPTKQEQQQVADCISSLDVGIAAESAKLDALKVHKTGLVQQIFPAMEDCS